MCSNPVQRYSHSNWSKASCASKDRTEREDVISLAASIACNSQRMLSEAKRDLTKPVWSL